MKVDASEKVEILYGVWEIQVQYYVYLHGVNGVATSAQLASD